MDHRIEVENLCTIHFEKILASQVNRNTGQSKYLKMYVIVDHYKNYIESNYRVIYKNYLLKEKIAIDEYKPIIQDWAFSFIDLAMDKYNEL